MGVYEILSPDGEWELSKLSSDLSEGVCDLILGIPHGGNSDGNDSLYWPHSSTGRYSTKTAYELIYDQDRDKQTCDWMWVWKARTHPRVSSFIWLCYHSKVPTAEHLNHRGLNVSPYCKICGQEKETLSHCLRDCSTTRKF